jgi:VWFA-related protein
MAFERLLLRITLASSLALAGLLSALSEGIPARAQEGVAGDNPVVTKPQDKSSQDPTKTKPASKIRVQSILVTTPVTAVDPNGNFVYDLHEGDFKVFDNGVPQQIQRFGAEMQPVSAVIVVETNDKVEPLLDQVRPLAPLFSDLMLGPKGQAAVITYSDRVDVAQDFSKSDDKLDTTLRGLKFTGRSARLNDAMARAIALLERRPKEERRVIVAFSDGYDNGSETSKEDVVRRAMNAEVTIYGLGFNPLKAMLSKQQQGPAMGPLDTNITRPLPPNTAPTPTAEQQTYGTPMPLGSVAAAAGEVLHSAVLKNIVEYYAAYTGGVFYSHWSNKAVQDQLNRVASEIHSQYELAYVPDTLDQTGFHRIEVRVAKPDIKIRARAGYFYEGQPQK